MSPLFFIPFLDAHSPPRAFGGANYAGMLTMERPMCPSLLQRRESREIRDSDNPRRREQLLIENEDQHDTNLVDTVREES
jgi:hypothetical protein